MNKTTSTGDNQYDPNTERTNLNRALYLVAIVNNKKPSYVCISRILQDCYKAKTGRETPSVLSQDSIATYFGRKVDGQHKISFPNNKNKVLTILEAVNFALFAEETNNYLDSFLTSTKNHPLFVKHRTNIDTQIKKETRQPEHQLSRLRGVLTAVDYKNIDANNIDHETRVAERNQSSLSAHLLYHNPLSAKLWDKIKEWPSYAKHYGQCQSGLENLLRGENTRGKKGFLKKALVVCDLAINLGAGSHTKDGLILQELASSREDEEEMLELVTVFVWVDASTPMLHQTFKQFDLNIAPQVQKLALVTDFEVPDLIEDVYTKSFASYVDYSLGKKVFFMLGFTLSNLNEELFFSRYANHMHEGDLLVFSIQFIPEKCRNDTNEFARFKDRVLSNYDFPDGSKLAKAGFRISEEYELSSNCQTKPKYDTYRFFDDADSLRISFKVIVKESEKSSCREITVTTAESFRHYKTTYETFLQNMGFAIVEWVKVDDDVFSYVVEYVGKNNLFGDSNDVDAT